MPYRWTANVAYAVGLIATDGCLSKDGRHISLTSTDIQLLETFRDCLRIKNSITKNPSGIFAKKKCYKIQFGNVKFYAWLNSIGLSPKKTYNIKKLDIPDIYFPDFLRGHLDGDGSVFTYVDRYMQYKGKQYTYERLYTVFISTSSEHIKWIRLTLIKLLNVKGSLSFFTGKNRVIPLWSLRFAKKDSLKILPWIYYDSSLPCLERKRKIAERFL